LAIIIKTCITLAVLGLDVVFTVANVGSTVTEDDSVFCDLLKVKWRNHTSNLCISFHIEIRNDTFKLQNMSAMHITWAYNVYLIRKIWHFWTDLALKYARTGSKC